MVNKEEKIIMTTLTNLANKQSEDVEDVKKANTRASVTEITVDAIFDPQQRAKAERALLWKLDLWLMPMIVLVFIMNYIGTLNTHGQFDHRIIGFRSYGCDVR
jgi:hypothetical protein